MHMENKVGIVIKSEDKRLVYGEVYAPMQVDTQGEAMTADQIEQMAHRFLSKGLVSNIDVDHECAESGSVVVESFIARTSDPDGFIEGSWVLGVKVSSDLWESVKSGELNGFSFHALTKKVPTVATVIITKRMDGDTEESTKDGLLPPHKHQVSLEFDDEGVLIPGRTSPFLSHEHDVKKATATESAMEHSHRLILIENA